MYKLTLVYEKINFIFFFQLFSSKLVVSQSKHILTNFLAILRIILVKGSLYNLYIKISLFILKIKSSIIKYIFLKFI